METRFLFWQRWLLTIAVIIAVFGFLMATFNGTVLFRWMDDRINPVFSR